LVCCGGAGDFEGWTRNFNVSDVIASAFIANLSVKQHLYAAGRNAFQYLNFLSKLAFAGKFTGAAIEYIGFFDHVIAHAIKFAHQLIAGVGREIDAGADRAVVVTTIAFFTIHVKSFGHIEPNDDVNYIARFGLCFGEAGLENRFWETKL